jgi:hypothetical protein
MTTKLTLTAIAATLAAGNAIAQSPGGNAVPVTVDNFVRAESDVYFGRLLKDSGGTMGKFNHRREPASIDDQSVIRLNRDTLYSSALFDLDAGPVTIVMPDAGKRFMSMQVINEDHYVPAVYYGAGTRTLTKASVGTRYVVVGVRTLVDPNDPKDIEQVHKLQDAIKVSQKAAGQFEVPNWDQASQKKVRDALLVLARRCRTSRRRSAPRPRSTRCAIWSVRRPPGAAIPTRTRSISTSRRQTTTARPSTSSTSKPCRSRHFGR